MGMSLRSFLFGPWIHLDEIPLPPEIHVIGNRYLLDWQTPRPRWVAVPSDALEALVELVNELLNDLEECVE